MKPTLTLLALLAATALTGCGTIFKPAIPPPPDEFDNLIKELVEQQKRNAGGQP